MKISFDTTSYTNANGSAPKGRNSYAFRVISVDGFAPDSDEIHFAPMMTLTEAKKFIRPMIKAQIQAECRENIDTISGDIVVEICA